MGVLVAMLVRILQGLVEVIYHLFLFFCSNFFSKVINLASHSIKERLINHDVFQGCIFDEIYVQKESDKNPQLPNYLFIIFKSIKIY